MSKSYIQLLQYLASVPGEIGPLVQEIEAITLPALPGTYEPFVHSANPPMLRIARLADKFPLDALRAHSGNLSAMSTNAEREIKLYLATCDNNFKPQLKTVGDQSIPREEMEKRLTAVSAPGGLFSRFQRAIEIASRIWQIWQQIGPVISGGIPTLGTSIERQELSKELHDNDSVGQSHAKSVAQHQSHQHGEHQSGKDEAQTGSHHKESHTHKEKEAPPKRHG